MEREDETQCRSLEFLSRLVEEMEPRRGGRGTARADYFFNVGDAVLC